MKATIEKYPDFEALKAAEEKELKGSVPKPQKVDLMQSFLAQFTEIRRGKELVRTHSQP